MKEAPENGKESSHSAHANGTNEWMNEWKALYIVKIFFRWNKNGACKNTEFKLQTHERGNENEGTREPKSATVSNVPTDCK
jgi:hypothetical protein